VGLARSQPSRICTPAARRGGAAGGAWSWPPQNHPRAARPGGGAGRAWSQPPRIRPSAGRPGGGVEPASADPPTDGTAGRWRRPRVEPASAGPNICRGSGTSGPQKRPRRPGGPSPRAPSWSHSQQGIPGGVAGRRRRRWGRCSRRRVEPASADSPVGGVAGRRRGALVRRPEHLPGTVDCRSAGAPAPTGPPSPRALSWSPSQQGIPGAAPRWRRPPTRRRRPALPRSQRFPRR
jgi:hypothetical protein